MVDELPSRGVPIFEAWVEARLCLRELKGDMIVMNAHNPVTVGI